MSTVLNIETPELCESIWMLAKMFPKGSAEVPVGFYLKDNELTITCLQGAVYQNSFWVNSKDEISATILYRDLTPLVTKPQTLTLEFTPVGVTISGLFFSASFPMGYSIVSKQSFGRMTYHDITTYNYRDSLKSLWNMGLEKLYNLSSPIIIQRDVALQKYPNTWVQVKTTGLPFDATLDVDHVKLFVEFNPGQVSMDIQGTLVFKKGNAILQIPCKANREDSNITELMGDLSEPVTLNLDSYVDKVRLASKLDTKSVAHIVIFEGGIRTDITTGGVTFSVSSGDITTKPVVVCDYPIQLWMTFLKNLSNTTSQVLIGGDRLCLRTATMIILTRVLL